METLLNFKFDWLHSQVICDSPEALYQLSIVKKAVSLWYGENFEFNKIDEVNRNIQEKILCMTLPKTFKNKISQMAEFICTQIDAFVKLLHVECRQELEWTFLKDKIFWTSHGRIDKRRTAEALVDATVLSTEAKFQIAASFCLENRINELAIQLPPDYLKKEDGIFFRYLNKIIAGLDGADIARQHFNITLDSCFESFQYLLHDFRHNVSCSYLWQFLTEEEKVNVLQPEFIEDCLYWICESSCILFLFTKYDKKTRLQLLQGEYYCYRLLDDLEPEWVFIFYAFIKENIKLFTIDSLAKLLKRCVQRLESTIAFKKEYVELCAMILQVLKQHLKTVLSYDTNQQVTQSIYGLMLEGELTMIKQFLESVGSKWLKNQFSIPEYYWECDETGPPAYLLMVCFKCEMLDFLILSVFPTTKQRKMCFSKYEFDCIIFELMFFKNEFDIDKMLSVLFSNVVDLNSYKKNLAKKRGFKFCSELVELYEWEGACNFIQWCFASQEEIFQFLKKFFQDEHFAESISTHISEDSEDIKETIISLIKHSLISQSHINQLLFYVCFAILSKCYIMQNKKVFAFLDKFLLNSIEDTKKNVIALRKGFFTDKDKKLYISLPLKFLKQIINDDRHKESWRQRDKLWRRMIDDFFHWICSSDEKLKVKLEEEFWYYFHTESCQHVPMPTL